MDYNSIAGDYHKHIEKDLNEDKLQRELIELVGIHNPEGWEILDVGCGSGIQTNFLAKRFPEIKQLVGVDSSKELIRIANDTSKDKRCSYTVGDMHALPLEDGQFNFIFSRYAVHYSNAMDKVMSELHRVCKPDGQIFVQVVHPIYELFKKPSKNYEIPEEADFVAQTTKVKIRHLTHTIPEYINGAIEAGLRLVNIEEMFSEQSNIDGYRVPTVLILRMQKPAEA